MRTQTLGRTVENRHKLLAGVLIVVALTAAIVGLAADGNLTMPGTGSQSATGAPVYDSHLGPFNGEGLPRSLTISAQDREPTTGTLQHREFAQPQGEGFPRTMPEQTITQQIAPLGEGLPKGRGQ